MGSLGLAQTKPPAAPDPLRALSAEFAPAKAAMQQAEQLTLQGALREAGEVLAPALDTVPAASEDLMGRYLARDLLLGKLIDNSEARFDDAQQLRWMEQRVELRSAFWGDGANAALAAQNARALQLCKLGRCTEALALQEEIYRKTVAGIGPDAKNTLVARHNQAITLAQAGRYAEALEISRTLAEQAERRWGPDDATTLRFRNGVATSYTDLGRYADALAAHESVYEARRRTLGPSAPDTLSSMGSLAASYALMSRHRESLSLSQRVYDMTREAAGERHPRTASAAAALAIELRRGGRLKEAREMSLAAWKTLAELRGARHPETLYAMNVHGSVLLQMEDFPEAIRVADEALAARRAVMGETHPLTLAALQSAGKARLAAGQVDAALAQLEAAHEAHRALFGDDHPYTLLALLDRMEASLKTDRLERVRPLMPGFQSSVERLRAQHGLSVKSRRTLFERYVEGYRYHALASLRTGDRAQAFSLAELSKARTLIESTALQRANRAGVLPREAQAQVDAHEARLAQIDRDIDEAGANAERRQALEAERNRVVRAYADTTAQLRERHPRYARLSEAPHATLPEAARWLPADTVFLSYLASGDRVMAFAVDRGGLVEAVELPTLAGLADTVDAYRRLIGDALDENQAVWRLGPERYRVGPKNKPPAEGAEAVSDAAPIGELLSRHLLAPLAAPLRAHRRVIVSPDAALALLPFEALPLEGRLLAQSHGVNYVQSLSMLALLQQRSAQYDRLPGRRTLLAVGNAVYREEGGAGAAAERSRGANASPDIDKGAAARMLAETDQSVDEAVSLLRETGWDNLPGTAREIDAVRGALRKGRVDAITGRDATEARMQQLDRQGELAKYRRLLFSVHGFLSPSVPALSALVLSQVGNPPAVDGYITAAEWPGYTLRSDLVVMSACETGLGKVVQGEGVMGLPYALYVAGNTNTVMTLWPVNDESTARFMASFFERLDRSPSADQALAETKKAFADGEFGEKLRKPVYWAPFVLYGGVGGATAAR